MSNGVHRAKKVMSLISLKRHKSLREDFYYCPHFKDVKLRLAELQATQEVAKWDLNAVLLSGSFEPKT